MDVKAVDPRDVEWEELSPAFRVYFTDDMGSTDEFELANAEVDEALTWARAKAEGRSFDVYVVVDRGQRGLVRVIRILP